MTTLWIAFVLALLLSAGLTRLLIGLSSRFAVLDRPDGYRKLHARPMPRSGGWAVYGALGLTLLALYLTRERSQMAEALTARADQMKGVGIGATLALVLGACDDIWGLKAGWKLLWQVVIGSVAYAMGLAINAISIPFGPDLGFGVLSYPVTVLWFVGCMNAVNLLDGLDGLAAGTCVFVSLTLLLVSLHFRNPAGLLMAAAIGGALLGFLLYNFPPARIFLGDSGSLLLGFLMAALSLVGASRKSQAAVALFIPIVALGLPILDTSMAILRRWYKRLPISAPDRQHVHHVLVSMGYSEKKAVLLLYGTCLLLGATALVIMLARDEVIAIIIGSLLIIGFVAIRVFGGVRLSDMMKKLQEDGTRRHEERETRIAVERAVIDLRQAESVEACWRVCGGVLGVLGIDRASLALAWESERRAAVLDWEREGGNGTRPFGQGDTWTVELTLECDGDRLAVLRVSRVAIFPTFEPELLDRLRTELTCQLCVVMGRRARMQAADPLRKCRRE